MQEISQINKVDEETNLENYVAAIDISENDFVKMNKKVLDLEGLTFQSGNHFMSNDKCKLPNKAYKLTK